MRTDTAENKLLIFGPTTLAFLKACLSLLLGVFTGLPAAQADMKLGPWVPLFKGIDYATGTNTPGNEFPSLSAAHIARIDLHDPDIRLFSSPRIDDFVADASETEGQTVSGFLAKHQLQLAVNAGLFDPSEYYLPAGTPMDIHALSICEGVVVSEQTRADEAATVAFTADNVPTVIHTNWPASPTDGIHTAVTGSDALLYRGTNLGYELSRQPGFIHRANPRTAFGISQDKRYLFILVIDGRQPGYSNGAFDYETAAWLLLAGAYDGINLDGGGSSTLVIEDSLGKPLRLNRSSAVADSGRERTVGNHFGIFARPLPGFINDLTAQPDDTTAIIAWETTSPSTTQVRYGTNPDTTQEAALSSAPSTRHSIVLTGLTPGTLYYFTAVSDDGTTRHVSALRVFTTVRHVEPRLVFDLSHPWKFTTRNLTGESWTLPSYDDASWVGDGPGLLWTDGRGAPRDGVQPATTSMPTDPGTGGFPYPTYYFRTRFAFSGSTDGVSLVFTNFIDDGAVFYLNGTEIQRVRMEEAPAIIANDALAIAFGCNGDATCPDVFTVAGNPVLPLQSGENVLAVEVHNYNARSPDVTFGTMLTAEFPVVTRPTLAVKAAPGGLSLEWSAAGFILQQAPSATGPWTDVPGPVLQSPFRVVASDSIRCYRLRK